MSFLRPGDVDRWYAGRSLRFATGDDAALRAESLTLESLLDGKYLWRQGYDVAQHGSMQSREMDMLLHGALRVKGRSSRGFLYEAQACLSLL